MPFTITRKGLISLWRDGVRLSQHTDEPKAYESAYAHAEANGDGTYRITFPEREVQIIVKRRTDGPSVPELGTPTGVTFDSVTVPLTRPSTGPAAISSYEIDRSTNGTTWTTVASGALVFGNPPAQYVDGGRLPLTTYYYRARAIDTSGRISAYSATVSATTSAVAVGTKKWYPGKYGRADAQGYPSKDAQHYAVYDKINTAANITGAEIPVNWHRTNPSPGVYDWSYVDAHIARITQNGTNSKKVCLVTQFQNYSGTVPTAPYNADNATLPNFILSAGWGATRTSGGVMPKLDITGCMDALIAWIQAMGAKYDGHPAVSLFTVGETSSAYAGMSANGYAAQWYRLPPILKNAWPNTFCSISHNGLTSPSTSIQLEAISIANGIGMGVEDAAGFYGAEPVQYGGWGYYARAGVGVWDDGDGNGAINYGTNDKRLAGTMRAEQQVVRSNVVTLAQVHALMNNHWKNSHSVWVLYFSADGSSYSPDFYGTSTPATAYSGNNVLAFLNNAANVHTRTDYPSG